MRYLTHLASSSLLSSHNKIIPFPILYTLTSVIDHSTAETFITAVFTPAARVVYVIMDTNPRGRETNESEIMCVVALQSYIAVNAFRYSLKEVVPINVFEELTAAYIVPGTLAHRNF